MEAMRISAKYDENNNDIIVTLILSIHGWVVICCWWCSNEYWMRRFLYKNCVQYKKNVQLQLVDKMVFFFIFFMELLWWRHKVIYVQTCISNESISVVPTLWRRLDAGFINLKLYLLYLTQNRIHLYNSQI